MYVYTNLLIQTHTYICFFSIHTDMVPLYFASSTRNRCAHFLRSTCSSATFQMLCNDRSPLSDALKPGPWQGKLQRTARLRTSGSHGLAPQAEAAAMKTAIRIEGMIPKFPLRTRRTRLDGLLLARQTRVWAGDPLTSATCVSRVKYTDFKGGSPVVAFDNCGDASLFDEFPSCSCCHPQKQKRLRQSLSLSLRPRKDS